MALSDNAHPQMKYISSRPLRTIRTLTKKTKKLSGQNQIVKSYFHKKTFSFINNQLVPANFLAVGF